MLLILHKQATNTGNFKAAIQTSKDSAWILTERYEIIKQLLIGPFHEKRRSTMVKCAHPGWNT